MSPIMRNLAALVIGAVIVQAVYEWPSKPPPPPVPPAPPPLAVPPDFDFAAHLSELDVDAKRQSLTRLIFGGELPAGLPALEPAPDSSFNAAGVLNVRMGDFVSRVYIVRPDSPNGSAFLYHAGHGADSMQTPGYVAQLRNAGYTVAVLTMPGVGWNEAPTIEVEGIGPVTFAGEASHALYALLPDGLRLFVEPVTQTVNYLRAEGYSDIAMMGLSGGGWTTTVAAALDPRITRSYPVAGSMPFPVRNGGADWEQVHPDLLRIASYAEMYVMGSDGGRRQLQVLNVNDSCCFQGRFAERYRQAITDAAAKAGGTWSLLLDDSHHRHMISPVAMAAILGDTARP